MQLRTASTAFRMLFHPIGERPQPVPRNLDVRVEQNEQVVRNAACSLPGCRTTIFRRIVAQHFKRPVVASREPIVLLERNPAH